MNGFKDVELPLLCLWLGEIIKIVLCVGVFMFLQDKKLKTRYCLLLTVATYLILDAIFSVAIYYCLT